MPQTITTTEPQTARKTVELAPLLYSVLKLTETELLTLAYRILKKCGYNATRQKSDHWIVGHPTGDPQPGNHFGLVAHCDLVGNKPPAELDTRNEIVRTAGGGILGADDRAGVAAILYLVLTGYRPYVYLTTGEETGGTGAKDLTARDDYQPPKIVRILIEPDRKGWNDFVTYQCDSEPLNNYCKQFGFEKATGSFTDISVLAPKWGIAAANLAIGYEGQHTSTERLVFPHFAHTVRRMAAMLDAPPAERIVYVERVVQTYTQNWKKGPSIASQLWDAVKKTFLPVLAPPEKSRQPDNRETKGTDPRSVGTAHFAVDKREEYRVTMLRHDYLWIGDHAKDPGFGYVHRKRLTNKERKRLDRAQLDAGVPIDPMGHKRAKWKTINDSHPDMETTSRPKLADIVREMNASADDQETDEDIQLAPTAAELAKIEGQTVAQSQPLDELAPLLEPTYPIQDESRKDCECLKCRKQFGWTDVANFDPINAICLKCLTTLQTQHGSNAPSILTDAAPAPSNADDES